MTTIKSDLFEAAAHLSPSPFKAYVGYLRVSSKRQATEGDSLDVQRDELAAYAREHGATLQGPHQDDLSGYRKNVKHRPGLRAAIDEALCLRVPLLVARIDRLTRSLDDLCLLDVDGLVIVAADRGVVGRATLKAAVAKAHAESKTKSRRAKDQHAERRYRSGWVEPPEFDSGRKKGALSNKSRAAQRVREVADFIRMNPVARELSHRNRADHLNSVGLLNLKSSSGIREPWTKEALRPVWRAEEALLMAEAAQAADGASVAASEALSASMPMVEANSPGVPSEELSRAEIFQRALEADCSAPRALTYFERKALVMAMREDVIGPKLIPTQTRKKITGLLRQRESRVPKEALAALQQFLRARVVAPDAAFGSINTPANLGSSSSHP